MTRTGLFTSFHVFFSLLFLPLFLLLCFITTALLCSHLYCSPGSCIGSSFTIPSCALICTSSGKRALGVSVALAFDLLGGVEELVKSDGWL